MDYRIQLSLALIKKDIASPLLAPRHIAGVVRMSVSRFYELFQKETGTVPAHYVRTLRFEKAKELLETSTLSVKEVAVFVGITDISHFVRDFKKVYGLSPKAYRGAHFRIQEEPHSRPAGIRKPPVSSDF